MSSTITRVFDSTSQRTPLLPERFAENAARYADCPALVIPTGRDRAAFTLTYHELHRRAIHLARELDQRLPPGDPSSEPIVALWMSRTSPGLLTAQLACWMSGAAYVAIDPALPDDHAAFLLDDADAALLLCDPAQAARARAVFAEDRVLVRDWRDLPLARRGEADQPVALRPDRLAYLLYTSGTTGHPKGVEVEHRSIAHLITEDVELFDVGPGDRVAQGSSPSYDSSIEETWLALGCGATLVVLDKEATRSGPDLLTWLRDQRISVLCPPPNPPPDDRLSRRRSGVARLALGVRRR